MVEFLLKCLIALPFVALPALVIWLVIDHRRQTAISNYWFERRRRELKQRMDREYRR